MPVTQVYTSGAWVPLTSASPLDVSHNALSDVNANQHHTKYTDGEAQAAVAGIYLPLAGGTLVGSLTIDPGALTIPNGNIEIGDFGSDTFRIFRINRNGEYAQAYAGGTGQGNAAAGFVLRFHNGTGFWDFNHGPQIAGARGFHNTPSASIPSLAVFQGWWVDAARRTQWRKVSGTQQEIAIMSNTAAHLGGIVMDHVSGDVMVGIAPRQGSQVRNVAHSSTDAPPAGSQPGDLFLVYT